jgi:hypothetical protein
MRVLGKLLIALALVAVLRVEVASAVDPAQASCRVVNRTGQLESIGSGTLVDCTAGGTQGLVLTCAHLFDEGTGEIVVTFPQVKSHGARLVALDRQADLAALAIGNPAVTPAAVADGTPAGSSVRAWGFGPNGNLRDASGQIIGEADAAGQVSMAIAAVVREGDSGGGVFDSQGRLVAVVWGESGGVTYASTGAPLRRFLQRVLGRETRIVQSCPTGTCLRPLPIPRPIAQVPVTPPTKEHLDELARRVTALEQTKQDRGEYLTRADLASYLPRSDATQFARAAELQQLAADADTRQATLLERIAALTPASGVALGRAAGTAAIGLLGISGPVGWGVLSAGTVGGMLVGRWLKRRGVGGRRLLPFRKS